MRPPQEFIKKQNADAGSPMTSSLEYVKICDLKFRNLRSLISLEKILWLNLSLAKPD